MKSKFGRKDLQPLIILARRHLDFQPLGLWRKVRFLQWKVPGYFFDLRDVNLDAGVIINSLLSMWLIPEPNN